MSQYDITSVPEIFKVWISTETAKGSGSQTRLLVIPKMSDDKSKNP
jgi:hypothetical protein